MKKIINPLVAALGGFLCITILSFFNDFNSVYVWLIPPFGATMVLVMSVHDSPLAQPKNIFFWTCFIRIIWINYCYPYWR